VIGYLLAGQESDRAPISKRTFCRIKSNSGRGLFREFPGLKKRLGPAQLALKLR
jgi:hypothetical protein